MHLAIAAIAIATPTKARHDLLISLGLIFLITFFKKDQQEHRILKKNTAGWAVYAFYNR